MASYLSYFTSNSSSAPSQNQVQRAQPASSTWTSTVSARLTSLRKALTKDSEEDDPDHEDCSHVSNVLRAYYKQKGQSRPDWLPADPKNPEISQNDYGQYGKMYGNQYGNQPTNPYGPSTHGRGNSGAGRVGGLNDLWDSSPAQGPSAVQNQSLRAPRPAVQRLRSSDGSGRSQASTESYQSQQTLQPPSAARPLPSQRAGSYQNTTAAGITSRSDRLRARLQGGGSGRNSPNASTSPNAYHDPDAQGGQQYGGGNMYGSTASNPRYDNGPGGRDAGADFNARGYHGSSYRPRPGEPR